MNCETFLPGHGVHWIQARKSRDWLREHPRLAGQLLEDGDDGWIVIGLDSGPLVRLWNHDVERLRTLARANGNRIWYQRRAALMGTRSPPGHYLFCVAVEGAEIRPCRGIRM